MLDYVTEEEKRRNDFFLMRAELQYAYGDFCSVPPHKQAELLCLGEENDSYLHDSFHEHDDMHPCNTSVLRIEEAIACLPDDGDLLELARRLQYRLRENQRAYNASTIRCYDDTRNKPHVDIDHHAAALDEYCYQSSIIAGR